MGESNTRGRITSAVHGRFANPAQTCLPLKSWQILETSWVVFGANTTNLDTDSIVSSSLLRTDTRVCQARIDGCSAGAFEDVGDGVDANHGRHYNTRKFVFVKGIIPGEPYRCPPGHS